MTTESDRETIRRLDRLEAKLDRVLDGHNGDGICPRLVKLETKQSILAACFTAFASIGTFVLGAVVWMMQSVKQQ